MKNSFMATYMMVGLVLSSISAKAENSGQGGGFSYYYTVGKYYREAKKFIANVIADAPAEELEALAKKYGASIDWKEFAEIIKNAKAAPDKTVTRLNPDGYAEPLIMDYDLKTRSIVALAPFFELFHKMKISNDEVNELVRVILHETSHLYGIGVNDDQVSLEFSRDLREIVNRYWYRCKNATGSAADIVGCRYQNPDTNLGRKKLVISSFENMKSEVKPVYCHTRIGMYKTNPLLDGYVSTGELGGGEKVTSGTVEFDIDQVPAGTVLVLQHACSSHKGDAMTLQFSDEKGNVAGVAPWVYQFKDRWVILKQELLKLDNGEIALK